MILVRKDIQGPLFYDLFVLVSCFNAPMVFARRIAVKKRFWPTLNFSYLAHEKGFHSDQQDWTLWSSCNICHISRGKFSSFEWAKFVLLSLFKASEKPRLTSFLGVDKEIFLGKNVIWKLFYLLNSFWNLGWFKLTLGIRVHFRFGVDIDL